MGQIYFSMGLCVVKIFCVVPKFVRELIFFAFDSFCLLDDIFYCTATNSLDIFSVSLFLANLDQTLFDLFSIFE